MLIFSTAVTLGPICIVSRQETGFPLEDSDAATAVKCV
ncbi:hypothetical protein DGo_PD0050 (plasmid) [Deinococcus gobiensis I-0]|uniref:Uncharacterized protein n=1 Tax=Deinococcus gobiensis (strain DSM 21396 / JCM 16679 / CGMCC 1.7299 / I-0) TaxID=745776 RepID=H8H3M7_DEIGI|nr:hypothetical protein DGo_PD0050 [Deinococcus gobiensis I-0]